MMNDFKDKTLSLFKTNITKFYSITTRANNVHGRQRKQWENKIIKANVDRIIRVIRNLFEQEKDYYKTIRLGIIYSSNYIEYESNGNRNKTLAFKDILMKLNNT